jgi:hypothetical protein
MKSNHQLLFILGLIIIAHLSLGQGIGIGTPSPNASAMLHITSPTNNRGLLIPSFSVGQIPLIAVSSASEGVFFFDPSLNKFCFYHSGSWYTLNQMVQTVNSSGILSALSHSGNMSVTGSFSSGSISNSGNVGTNTISSNSISNSGNISTGSLNTSGTVTSGTLAVPGFANNALVPSGVIVMWSGSISRIPPGWALCDGTSPTPDLRNRFIVGAGYSYNVSDTGGEDFHYLTTNEMPTHSHHIIGTNKGDLGGAGKPGVASYTGDEEGGYTESTGGGASHENRPPYFALAYIMKL